MSNTTEPSASNFTIGELVEIRSTSTENSLLKGKLALVRSTGQIVDLGEGKTDTAYAVTIEGANDGKPLIAYGSELASAPPSDRYDDDKITGDVVAKRFNEAGGIYAVKLITGEVVIKTKSRK